MPELPEVETTRLGLAPHLIGRTITGVICRVQKLRLPLDPTLPHVLVGQTITAVERRGKYLLLRSASGTLLIHLGMSGHLRLYTGGTPATAYDHVELSLDNGRLLRLADPRKFGTVVWTTVNPLQHPLLVDLGPEPLVGDFTGDYLFAATRNRRIALKLLLMNNQVVVGVGNIYANESCFRARISPFIPAQQLSLTDCKHLVAMVQKVLREAIALGGTTLGDYVDSHGEPGYFSLKLAVYGREGKPCPVCGTAIIREPQGGRSTYWCSVCQK
jgi:formamidopyrimidine-DNA glycosylase